MATRPQPIEIGSATEIWNTIDEYIDSKKISYNGLNSIEKAVINCDEMTVSQLLKNGERIYTTNMLCNGYYQRKYNNHPTNCHSFICQKTAVYYGLWINTYYYSQIFSIVLNILDNINNFRFVFSEDDTRDPKVKQISNHIRNIYDILINTQCACHTTASYVHLYDHNTNNFKNVYDVLSKNVAQLINLLERNYGEDVQYLDDTHSVVTCHKKNLGKIYLYDPKIDDLSNAVDLPTKKSKKNKFLPIADCDIESLMGKSDAEKRKIEMEKLLATNNSNKSNDRSVNVRLLSSSCGKLKKIWDKYVSSFNIVKLLFNQQAYEYYKYNMVNKLYKLEAILDEITINPYVDINYNVSSGDNILSLTITQQNRSELVIKIKNLGGKLPDIMTIADVIGKCFIGNVKEIVRNVDPEYLGDPDRLLSTILTNEKMMSSDKIELVEILIQRGLLDNSINVIQTCVKHDKSISLIEKLSERKKIIEKTCSYDVYLCIKLMKHRELNILFTNCPKLINDNYEELPPLIHYFNETKHDDVEEKLLLKAILNNKPNLSVTNKSQETPLLIAVKNERHESFNLLIGMNASPFDYDNSGHNSFHYAIMKNNMHAINVMKKFEYKGHKIINEKTKISELLPMILAIDGDNPVAITNILFSEEGLDYNGRTPDGENVLHYLLKANINLKTKKTLFKMYLTKNIDLLESNKSDMKPIVVGAVERNLYDIVILIMNRLLELGEIKFDGYDNIRDIRKLIQDHRQKNIIVKDQHSPNYYFLVMVYLKTAIPEDYCEFDLNLSLFVTAVYILLYMICNEYELIYSTKHDQQQNTHSELPVTDCTINFVNEETGFDTYTGVNTLDDKTDGNDTDIFITNNDLTTDMVTTTINKIIE